MTDEDLIELIHTQPEKGYRKLLEIHQQPLYFFVRKIVFQHEDANDVIQNVWVKVFKNIRQFRGDSKLSTWLYKIATNETYTFLKKEAKMKKSSIEDISISKAQLLSEDPLFSGDEMEQMLYTAVAALPNKQRIVFQLKYFEEKKYEEISEILETSVGALKASYHFAVQKIKEQIEWKLVE